MVNIVVSALLLIMLFSFVANSSNSSLKVLSAENDLLQIRAQQYVEMNTSMTDAANEDLIIGQLE